MANDFKSYSKSNIAIDSGTFDTMYTAILNKETIVNSRAIFIPEILKRIPGVAISRSGPIGTARQARIRGAEANHVLVLIDGIEANDLAAGSEFDFSHLFLSNIEKIEVMRGAQSTLWGSDALAGVINIITDNATEDRQIFTSLTGKNNTYNNYFNLAKIKDIYSFCLYGPCDSSEKCKKA